MHIQWKERSIQWFYNASAYTSYDKELAELLLKQIQVRGSLCDLGCGLGLVDMEMAPYIGQITCLDSDATVVEALRKRAAERGIQNITARVGDARQLEGHWDTVLTMFHGQTADFVERYIAMADHVFLALVHSHAKQQPNGAFSHTCAHIETTIQTLERRGIPYEMIRGGLEYGQPLKSLEEAREYALAYSNDSSESGLAEYLERMVETGEEEFPYYLPKTRNFGLFVVRTDK